MESIILIGFAVLLPFVFNVTTQTLAEGTNHELLKLSKNGVKQYDIKTVKNNKH